MPCNRFFLCPIRESVEFDNPADGVEAGEACGADFFVGFLAFDIAGGK